MKINLKDKNFWFMALIYSGMQGYIFLGILQEIPTLLEAMFHPLFLYLSFYITYIFTTFFLIYLSIKKRQITKKEILNCIIIIPLMIWSYFGQLGNSEAIGIIMGNSIGILYSIILIPIYVYSIINKSKEISS